MQRSHPFVLLLVAGLLTGCVSSSKYHELETKASTDRTSLEKDIASLRSQVASQRDEVARREAQIASLNQQISSLNQQSTDLEAKKAGLERDIAALGDRLGDAEKRAAEAAAQKDAEINRLKGTYDSLVKDLQSEISKGEIKVTQIRDKLSVQRVEKIPFDSGKAENRRIEITLTPLDVQEVLKGLK